MATIDTTEYFSYAEITWKIRNISLAFCPATMTFHSDEFQITGPVHTLWRMTFSMSHQEDKIKIYLKMLGPDLQYDSTCCSSTTIKEDPSIKLHWKANILDSNGEQPLINEDLFKFNLHDNIVVKTFKLSDIVSDLPCTGPDDLILKCYILIEHGNKIDLDAPDMPVGIFYVSSALDRLVNGRYFSDIEIDVGRNKHYLHKEMFVNVKRIVYLIQEQRTSQIKLLNYDERSMNYLFHYVYSGNLKYILSYPSIRIAEDIERLDIPDLKSAYPKEKIEMETVVGAKEYHLMWKIENLQDIEDPLNGPELNEEGMNSRWQIRFLPRGKVNSNQQEKRFAFLEFTLFQSDRTDTDVNIEVSCVNEEDEVLYSLREHKRIKTGDRIDVPLFRRGGSCMKKCLIKADLKLKITFWIATMEVFSEVKNVILPRFINLNQTLSLNLLSRKMRHIFHQPKYDDIVLYGDRFSIRAHKFVLGSTSSAFRSWIDNRCLNLTIPNVKRNSLLVFIEYLYTGLFSDVEDETNYEIFNLGLMFGNDHLIRRFNEEVNEDNILDVMLYAERENLLRLKKEGFKVIAKTGPSITKKLRWNYILHNNTSLALAILSFLKSHESSCAQSS